MLFSWIWFICLSLFSPKPSLRISIYLWLLWTCFTYLSIFLHRRERKRKRENKISISKSPVIKDRPLKALLKITGTNAGGVRSLNVRFLGTLHSFCGLEWSFLFKGKLRDGAKVGGLCFFLLVPIKLIPVQIHIIIWCCSPLGNYFCFLNSNMDRSTVFQQFKNYITIRKIHSGYLSVLPLVWSKLSMLQGWVQEWAVQLAFAVRMILVSKQNCRIWNSDE